MATIRQQKMGSQIQRKVAEVLLREIGDPRVDGLVSITRVEVTPDLAQARVFVSIMGSEDEQKQAMAALTAASGFMHRELKKRLDIRKVPFLSFRLDTSIAKASEILSLLDKVQHEDEGRSAS